MHSLRLPNISAWTTSSVAWAVRHSSPRHLHPSSKIQHHVEIVCQAADVFAVHSELQALSREDGITVGSTLISRARPTLQKIEECMRVRPLGDTLRVETNDDAVRRMWNYPMCLHGKVGITYMLVEVSDQSPRQLCRSSGDLWCGSRQPT